jgi:hypothetical protein
MNEDENGFVAGEEKNDTFYTKFRMVNEVFCSIFEKRKSTSVGGLGNISNFFSKIQTRNNSLWRSTDFWFETSLKTRYG